MRFFNWITFGLIKIDHAVVLRTIKNFGNTNEIFAKTDLDELNKLLETKYFKKYFNQFDTFFCCFPPAIFEFVKVIADKYDKKIILNIGHRFNIWIKTHPSNKRIKQALRDLFHNKKHIVACASEYDYRYTKHYLGLDLNKLYLKTFHIPLTKKYSPKKNTILIGPTHVDNALVKKYNLNKAYQKFCKDKGIAAKFTFKSIREELGFYDDVRVFNEYFGFIIFPYSSFSVSGLELYEYNLPYFYPSVDFLQKSKMCNDYILYPTYCTEKQYRKMENDIDDENSPNNYADKATRKWMKYFSGYQHKNTIIFENIEDLFDKILQADKNFASLSENMFLENKTEREQLLEHWKKLLH